jgi:RHS repeat-associated protein
VSRTVTSGTTTTTTIYVHDIHNHIIAERDAAGVTHREYIWLDDLPVAVVDQVDTASPQIFMVHTDHLGRPVLMTASNGAWVWYAIYDPFGKTSYVWSNSEKMDIRFPGQWFQLESGLAYNWHRHYDASLGRYLQPDPLRVDEKEGVTVGGIATPTLRQQGSLVDQILQSATSRYGALEGGPRVSSLGRSNYPDGPSIYGYSKQNPLAKIDPKGLVTTFPYTPRPDAGVEKCEYPPEWKICHERCLLETEGTWPSSDRPGLYRRCMRECLGPNADY